MPISLVDPGSIGILLRLETTDDTTLFGLLVVDVTGAVDFAIGLFLTQKIAGPLTALRKRLSEIADAKEGVRLHLRDTDEFKNIQYLFNEAMEKQEKKIRDLRDKLSKASPA